MKKILVLGGSYMQSDFINTANSLGYEVHVLDMDSYCYASRIKDIKFTSINIADEKLVEQYFVKHKCDVVIAPVTEIGNRIACNISNKLGLNYNPPDTVRATTDKSFMREMLKKNDSLEEPISMNYTSIEDVEDRVSYPFIVKPPISSASRGVTFVRNREEFETALKEVIKYTNNISDVLIEEFIDGDQYSIETLTFSKGKHYLIALTREYLSSPPHYMERMDVISKEENIQFRNFVQEYVSNLLNTLNITVGPCHIEVKIKGNKIRLIEIASRSGMLRDRLIKTAKGCDYNKLIVDSYLQNNISEENIFTPKSNGLLGVVAYPFDFQVYLNLKKKNLIEDDFFYSKGLSVQPKQLTDAVGYFFVESEDFSILKDIELQL